MQEIQTLYPQPFRRRLRRTACGALAGLLISTGAWSAAPASTPPDVNPAITEFRVAWQRVASGQPDQPDPAALQALAIYPYLVAARLSRDLAGPAPADTDARVSAFLTDYAGEPVTHPLAANWLDSLGQRQAWPEFLAHFDAARATPRLECQRFAALLATGATNGLSQAITKAYLTGQDRPDCAPAFDWLKAQGALPTATIEARAQLALEARNVPLARTLAQALPDAAATRIQRWAALVSSPVDTLRDVIAHPQRDWPYAGLTAGFSRLVRSDTDTAVALYPQLLKTRRFTPAQARPFTRLLALGLAWDRKPLALQYFDALGPVTDDPAVQEWRIRSALWAADWTRAQRWIAALPPQLAHDPQWRYWQARVAAARGKQAVATPIYTALANGNGYYALLASWRLGRPVTPHPTPLADQPELDAGLDAVAGIQRARELYLADLASQADVEWRTALASVTPDQRQQAVWLAHRWGWYLQSIATAARQGIFDAYAVLYPRPYRAEVKRAAQASRLPTDWIYAVTRQESLYNAQAVSSANALGLMQLLPATARAVAQRNQLPIPAGRADLFDPATNLLLGATHLRELLDRENGSFIVTLAGYNAGPRAAQRWLPPAPMAADIWIENVPYNETRRYIQRILWHTAIFGWEASGKGQNMAPFLKPVAAPQAAGDADA